MTQTSTCRWKPQKHDGQPCPYHGALANMITAARNNDYASYEQAKQDAENNKDVDSKKNFFGRTVETVNAEQDISMIEQTAQGAFEYDKNQQAGMLDNATLIHDAGGAQVYDIGYTARRAGVEYHNTEESCTREEMVQKIDELFFEGKTVQALGLAEDLKVIERVKKEDPDSFLKMFANEETVAQLQEYFSHGNEFDSSVLTPETTINFDAEILTHEDGLVKTFSTAGGEHSSEHLIPFTPHELLSVNEETVRKLSAKNDEYAQDVHKALKASSDQDTRESIAMHYIHAVEFGKAVETYPEGAYKNVLRAEVAGMMQYASRLAKYQQGRSHTDDTDLFMGTRLGDLSRYDSSNRDRAGSFNVEEKLIANGITRQNDIAMSSYDDELWGSYGAEAKKYYQSSPK